MRRIDRIGLAMAAALFFGLAVGFGSGEARKGAAAFFAVAAIVFVAAAF